jgi:hypothetical protein
LCDRRGIEARLGIEETRLCDVSPTTKLFASFFGFPAFLVPASTNADRRELARSPDHTPHLTFLFAGYWDKILPKRHIVQGLRQDVLDWLIARQKKAIAKYGIKDPSIKAFIIFDDVIADQKAIRWSADLNSFVVEGNFFI